MEALALYNLLQERGEKMTQQELVSCLTNLVGEKFVAELMDSRLNAGVFASQVLGFGM